MLWNIGLIFKIFCPCMVFFYQKMVGFLRRGISWYIEKISYSHSWGHLKKKWKFQGSSKGVTQFYRISKSKDLFCPEFARIKVEFLKVINKKSCWTFMSLGFWSRSFLSRKGVKQFSRISRGKERFVLCRFSGAKVTKLKDPVFYWKGMPSIPLLIFLE